MPELNPKIPEAGNITNPPDQTPDRVPYIPVNNDGRMLEKPTTVVRTAPAPQRKTWAGYLDSGFFQFNPQQPIWYYSDDFLYNTLDRMLGFDRQSRVWRPFNVDGSGNVILSATSTISFPLIFEDSFFSVAIDSLKWTTNGNVLAGPGFATLDDDDVPTPAFLRSQQFFSFNATNPLVVTANLGIDIPPAATAHNCIFGLIDTSAAIGDSFRGVWALIESNPDASYDVTLNYSADGVTVVSSTTQTIVPISPAPFTISLYVSKNYAAVFVDGEPQISTYSETTIPIIMTLTPDDFPNGGNFNVLILSTGVYS